MRSLSDKIARTDEGFAEARLPLTSVPSSLTAQFSITTRGVYYMTGNVTGVAGLACIEVLTDNVEIECDGFVFIGVPGTLECIRTPSPQSCIGIYDAGFVQWQHTCIDLSNSSYCYCEELWFHQCDASGSPLGLGACALGAGGTIDDCNVLACTHGQLSVDRDGIVEECVVVDSTGGGLSSPGPVTMEDNFVLNNDGAGITVGSGGGVVIGNRISACGSYGVEISASSATRSSVVSENDITACGSTGIYLQGSHITCEENHVSRCPTGIVVTVTATDVMVDSNHCAGTSSNAITLENGSSRCLVIRNVVSTPPGVPGYALNGANSWGPILSAVSVGDISGSGTTNDPFTNIEC